MYGLVAHKNLFLVLLFITFLLTANKIYAGEITSTPIADQSGNEVAAISLDVAGNFTDSSGDTLTFSADGLPAGTGIDPATGVISGTLPLVTADTPYTISVIATDGEFSANQNFTLTVVNSINDAPVAQDGTLTTDEDTPATGSLVATDIDNASLTFSIVSQGSKGTVTITNTATGAYSYTPNANANGTDSFTFKANDGTADSNSATVNVTVNAINDAPVATGQSVSTNRNTAKAVTLTATDVDGDTLTYSVVTPTSHGTLTGTAPTLTYTPATGYSGGDSFTFKANDGTVDSNSATVSITVDFTNVAPVANAQSDTTAEDTAKAITLGGSDADGDPLTYSVVTQPAHGTLTGTAPNLTYTPAVNYNGTDSFTFKANDGTVDSNTAIVSVTITAINDAPVASGQSVSTNRNTAKAVTLAATDVDGDTLTYSVVTQPSHGTLTGTAPTLTYTPSTGYSGSDSFTFKANDGTVDSNSATVSITVDFTNVAPVANAQSVTTSEDTAKAITLAGSDADGDPLTYSVVTQPAHGTLSGTAPNLTFTPAANYNGPDSFTFKANDGTVDSAPATVSLSVTAVNDAPVANGQSVSTAEDTAKAITLTGSDVDGNSLTYSIVTQPAHGTLSGTAPNLTYTPAVNYNGTDSFTFKANDGTVDSAPATVSLSVTAVNDAPVANGQSVSTAEDTAKAITLTGSDVDGNPLTYSIVTQSAHGTLSGTAPNLTYTPATNYNGTDSFTFKANDGTVDSAPATVSLSVTAVNDAPVANAQSVSTNRNTAKAVTLAATDVDGDTLTYSVVTQPSHGTLTGTAPNLTYTPSTAYSGGDSFTFKANDGTVDSNSATVSITVDFTNVAPVANAQSVSTNRNTAKAVTLTATDVDGDTLTYSVVTQPAHGTLTGTAPTLTYTPSTAYSGGDSFTFKANDGTVDSNSATVSITVDFTNVAPVANAQSVTTAEDTAKAITLAGSDADGDPLTYSVVTQPAHGTLSGTAPNLTFTPAANYNGPDSFTFKANDGTVDSAPATLSLSVTAVNDAPVANGQSVSTAEDTAKAITLTGSDADGNPLTYSIVTQPAHGTLSGTAPNLTYTPATNYNGTDSFTFKANDGTVDSNTAIVSVTITAINDAPVANAQSVSTNRNTAKAVTLTATDVDGDTLTYSVVTQPAHGTLTGTAPTLTYTPSTAYSGGDSFTFKANDGTVDSNSATVSITVDFTNVAPVANAQSVTTAEDTAKAITLAGSDADGDPLTYSVVTQPAHGTLSGTAPNLTFTPAANYNGPDSFTFKANDGTVDSAPATVSLSVTAVNDAPVANGQSVSTAEDTAKAITLTGSDVDGNSLTYSIVTQPAHGTLSGTAPNLTYTPAVNYNGTDSFTFKANDGTVDSAPATVNITITPVNDAPNPPTLNAPPNGTPNVNEVTTFTPTLVVNNAIDPDGDNLSYTFEIDTNINFNSVKKQTSPIIAEGAGTTSWTTTALTDNTTWYWRAKANDGLVDGQWMTAGSFFVNTINNAPTAPTVNAPPDNGRVSTLTPTLTVNAATDVDFDPLKYEFAVYSDISLNPQTQIAGATDQGTSWTVDPPLENLKTYYWTARTKDNENYLSPWMAAKSFYVDDNGVNDPPTITINAPGVNEPSTNATSYTIRWNAADPDSNATITLYYDNNNSGNNGTQIVTGIKEDTSANSFTWNTSALPDGTYYIYAMIKDELTTVYAYSSGPLVIDRTSPSAPVVTGTTPTNNTKPTWNWSSGGGGGNGSYRYKLDNSDLTNGATEITATTFTPAAAQSEGSHTVYVQERDVAGNWSASGSFPIVVDLTAPSTTINSTAADATRISPILVTVTFSEAVTGFTVSDIVVNNGTAGSLSGSGASYSFNVTPAANGAVTVDIAAAVAQDAAGNANTAASQFSRTYDNTAPTVTISSTAANPTRISPIPVTVTFSEAVTGFELGDVVVNNGTAGSLSGSGANYSFNVTPAANGTVTVDLAAAVVQDAAGNANTAASQFSRSYDNTAPTVTISSTAANPTRVAPIPVTVTFSKAVTGFTVSDIVVNNGTAGSLSGSGASYSFNVTPAANGAVTVDIAAAVAQDAAGNANTAASQLSRAYDNTAPTVTISSLAANPTRVAPISVTVTFSEAVTGFELGDVVVSNGTAGSLSGSGASYSFNVTPAANGAVTVDIAAAVAQDAAGNANSEASQFSRTYDNTAPTVTISSTAADPTRVAPIPITVTFSEEVTGFTVSDIVVSNGTAGSLSGSGASYSFNVTPAANGAVTVDIAAAVAQDAAGNANSAASQFSRTYDNTAPTVTISSTAANPTRVAPIPVTVTFSKAVTGFELGDIVVNNGTAASFSGSGANYSFNVTPATNGTVTVDIAAGVAQDAAGNANSAASQFSRTYDITAPTVTISSTAANPTRLAPIPVTVTFSEAVTGFTVSDIVVSNGTAGSLSGSGANYSFNVTPAANGAVTVDIAAAVAQDAAGNTNSAASQFSRAFDSSAPTVTISSTAADPTRVAPIPVTVNFSKAVTGFELGDIVVSNGTAGSLSGSGASYSFNVIPAANGAVTVDIAAGVAQDAAGNANSAASQFSRTYDNTAPTVTISSTAANPTRVAPIPVTVTFSEAVTGFELGDIVVNNGTAGSLSGSGASYSFNVTPAANGAVTVDIAAAVAQDAAGNANTAASQFSRTYDNTAPTVNTPASYVDSTHVEVTFSETVVNAELAANYIVDNSLTITGAVLVSGATYRLTTSPQFIGTNYTITAKANIVDPAGNAMSSSGNKASFTRPPASNSPPSIPTYNSIAPVDPAYNNEPTLLTPTLKVNASTDPDGDPITYTFEVSALDNFSTIAASKSGITASGGVASWTVSPVLYDNTTYYWRARANDGYVDSGNMPKAQFFVNTANDAPTGLAVSLPADKTQVATKTPVLTVTNASDPDHDTLTYEFEVYSDSDHKNIVTNGSVTPQVGSGTQSWTVPSGKLADNISYYWKVWAKDQHGLAGNSVSAEFFVNTANDPPTAPTVNAPTDKEVTTLTPTLVVNNATDPDRETLIYTFEIDTNINFNTANKQTSSIIVEGAGTTSWPVAKPLTDNTTWYWRVKATDTHNADGPPMTAQFFVNLQNDAPTAPTVNTPLDNGRVSTLTPTLTINAATDIDNDPLTYEFEVYADRNLTPASFVIGKGNLGTSYTVETTLSNLTTYYWIARAKDNEGTTSAWMPAQSFYVDSNGVNDPPTLNIDAPGTGVPPTNANSYVIRWIDADPDSNAIITLYWDNDNSGNNGTQIVTGIQEDDSANSYTWNTSALPDGTYYVYGMIKDEQTTVYAYSTGPLVIDRTKPSAPVVSGTTPINTATPTWNWGSGGNGGNGTYRYKLDSDDLSTGATETSATTYTPTMALNEVPHTLYVQERDAAGNWSLSGSFAIVVDLIPPTAEISGVPASPTNVTSATLTVGGNDVVAYKYKKNAGGWSGENNVTIPIPLTSLGDGTQTVYVIGKDSAGNWQAEANATSASWTIDLNPPRATISGKPSDPTNIPSATLSVSGDGVVAYKYALDAGAYSAERAVTETIHLMLLNEGVHTVSVIGRDNVGNWQAETDPTIVSWTVDLTPPSFKDSKGDSTISTISDGAFTNQSTLNITGIVTDNIGMLTLAIRVVASGASSTSDVPFDVHGNFSHPVDLRDGANVITITATDRAGNQTSDVRTVNFDPNGTKLVIDAPADGLKTNRSDVAVTGSTGETSTVTMKVNSGVAETTSKTGTSYSATAYLVPGLNTIELTATDLDLKTNTLKRTVTFDDQKPTLSITEPAEDTREMNYAMTVKGTVADTLTPVTLTIRRYTDKKNNDEPDDSDTFNPTIVNGEFVQALMLTADRVNHIVATARDEAGNETTVQRNILRTSMAPDGDIDDSKKIDFADALLALQIAMGQVRQTDSYILKGDLAPLVNGRPKPDGKIDLGDAVIILQVVMHQVFL